MKEITIFTVKEIKLELLPLTIIAGEDATGKDTMSYWRETQGKDIEWNILEFPEHGLTGRSQLTLIDREMNYVKPGSVQMIVTNSDHIFNGVRIAVLKGRVSHKDVAIYFFNADQGVDRIYLDKGGRCDHWPDGFFDTWDKALGTIIDGQAETYSKNA